MPHSDAAAVAGRFENFRIATEAGKGDLERELERRKQRYQRLQEEIAALEGSERDKAVRAFEQREEEALLARCKVWTTADFEQVQVLGQGSFGVVHLVKRRGTEEYYALKQMLKAEYTDRHQRARVIAERNLLAEQRSRWFVDLLTTFQDAQHVYMVMEFLQGGDLALHIASHGALTPIQTCFYMAELLEALDTVHRAGYIHRDVKPDNMVLASNGHLKLLDFGLCVERGRSGPRGGRERPVEGVGPGGGAAAARGGARPSSRARLRSMVGTPLYQAPELLSGDYDEEVDIWALGAIAYECLTGRALFAIMPDSVDGVRRNILNHTQFVPAVLRSVRDSGVVPPSAEQLLLGVLCDREVRLGAEEIRTEPFFAGIDFPRLHLMQSALEINISSPTDTRYFKAVCALEAQGGDFSECDCALPPPDAAAMAMKDEALEWARYEFHRKAFDLEATPEVAAI